HPRLRIAAALVLGVLLVVLAALGSVPAVVGGWLAQPALALGVRGWRGDWPAHRRDLLRDAGALLLLWGAALALCALLVAWPLAALRDSGGLGAALSLSAAVGVGVIALWRTWPLWHAAERSGGGLDRHWRAMGEHDASSWRGFIAGVCVAGVLAPILLLAWPGLLEDASRWIMAAVSAATALLLHAVLQRLRAPESLPAQMPVVEMPGVASTMDADAGLDAASDQEAALYAAARLGRVDRALELIDAGADALSPPP